MESPSREHIFRCPCYEDYMDYQKIVELRDAGLVIYRRTRLNDDVNLGTNKLQSQEVFILRNTKDVEITSADIMPTLDESKISCPRCRHIIENAKRLLNIIPKINRNDIIGICDHCRRKLSRSPCQECDELAKNFVTGTSNAKDRKRHIKNWLSKIHRLLQDVVVGEKGALKKGRVYSDINIQNIHHNSPVSLREPEVGDLFYSETLRTGSTKTLNLSDRSYFSHPNHSKVKKHTTFAEFFDNSFFDSKKYKQFISRSHQDLPFFADDSLSLLETEREKMYTRKSTTGLTKKAFPDGTYEADDILKAISDISLTKPQRMPREKYKSEDALKLPSDRSSKTLPRIFPEKYKSENAIPTSISNYVEDDYVKEGFGYLFLKEEDKIKLPTQKGISSSELIKNTQDMLQARAELEKLKREEEYRKKLEEQERKRKAREEKQARAERERLLREEAKRLAEEEAKKIAAEEKKRQAEEEKRRLAEEKAKKLAEEEEKKRVKEEQKKEKKQIKGKPDSNAKKPADLKEKEKSKPTVQKEKPPKMEVKPSRVVEKPPKVEQKPQKVEEKVPKVIEKQPKIEEKPPKVDEKPHPPKVENQKKETTDSNIKDKESKKVKDDRPKEKKEVADKKKDEKLTDNKEVVKEPAKPKDVIPDDFNKLLAEQAKQKEEMRKLKKQQEEDEKKAREAAEKLLKEKAQSNSENKALKKPQSPKPISAESKPEKKEEKPTTKELNIKQIKVRKLSGDDLILQLVKLKQSAQVEKGKIKKDLDVNRILLGHKSHQLNKDDNCLVCKDSDIELELESIANNQEGKAKVADIIVGQKIFKYKPPLIQKHEEELVLPILFKSCYQEDEGDIMAKPVEEFKNVVPVEVEPTNQKKPTVLTKGMKGAEQEVPKGIIRYALSDRTFIDKGWTMLPTEKVVRKMNVYRMRPAQPEFDWFEHNKNKRLMQYDTGEKLAEFDDNGRGRWFYKNGRLALDYYDAEEINAQQRYVVYSSGEPDERGRSRPITILATFDYLGNGVVFDHSGKIRLKYNQTEGVVLDRAIGPVSHWKWHTLNDPPVLQQVMIDTQMSYKDPDIAKLGGPGDNKARPDNEEMLAIEFDNFIKEKSKKLTQKFKPFQIKMKALKINESFSLKVLDQATVYLIFRDGSANLKLNIGMILDHKEIVDTDTAEVGEVSSSLERLPARTDSIAGLQASVAHAQRVERQRVERERRLRPAEPCGSADRLTAPASKPLRPPFRTAPSCTSATSSDHPCKCRKPSSSNLYYDTRLI